MLLVLSISLDSFGQFNRKSIKRNNKRIATYTGKKKFGREKVYSGVGFSLNAMNYYGDLAPLPSKFSTDISFTRPGIGISFFHRFGPRYTLIAQFMYGTLKGSDSESAKGGFDGEARKGRNLSFRNRIKEISFTAIFDLFENDGTYISRVKWTPYAFVGIGAYLHNPQAQAPKTYLDGTTDPYSGKWVDLQPLGTEGQYSNMGVKPYSLLQVAVPFGVGARFRINEVLDFWADIGFRYTFTDYLDDVSKEYVDLSKLQAKDASKSKLAEAMSYRTNEVWGDPSANPSAHFYPATSTSGAFYTWPGYGSVGKDNNRGHSTSKDVYMVTSLKITYILGATFHRAKFR